MRRRRWRKFVLRSGTALSLFIAIAFAASARWQIALQVPASRGPVMILMAGSAVFITDEMWTVLASTAPHKYGLSRWNRWGTLRRLPSRMPVVYYVEMPLYALFLVTALPALLVWRFVPKFPRGHCRRCGYNLTGLTEARCPECGQPFEAKGDAP